MTTRRLTDEERRRAGAPQSLAVARRAASDYARNHPGDPAEFESAAIWGLIGAAATWNPDGGASWTTHAYRRCMGAILDGERTRMPLGFRRADSPERVRAGGDVPVVASLATQLRLLNEVITLGDAIPADTDPVGWELEAEDEVRHLTRGLEYVARELVIAYFLRAGVRLRDLGSEVGLCESRVSQLVQQALVALARTRAGGR